MTDTDTHARFTPLSLGPAPTVDGRALCLASANLFNHFESARGFADPQDSRITRIDTDYVLNSTSGASCTPGLGDASQADLQISTFARGSAVAAANRRAFAGARTVRTRIMGLIAHVSLMRGGDQATLALADVGNRTVLIRSSLPTGSGSQAITRQILSILSGLHGSSLNPTAAASRVTPRAVLAARAAAVEDITHANWLFTGSTYNQSSGTPDRKNREDPVSVIWKGGGQATINNVRNYTQTYWQESAIPHGYPGGKEMKVRDSSLPPSKFCRSSSHVWFRRTGTAPNKGKFEESDPHGYMSTNGLCGNQYHIRMYSSSALHKLTGAHLREFVLAPIHHDHVRLKCLGPIVFGRCVSGIYYPKHGRPDLSFDKARYAYARVMSFKVCTVIHWKVNPESEQQTYQRYKYSGWVSRITFKQRSRHSTCKGV